MKVIKVIKKSSMIVVLLAVVAVFLAACSGGSSNPPPPPPPPTTGSVQLYNYCTTDIDEIYIALSSSSSWGSKRNTNPIPSGYSWTLSGFSPETYDGMAVIIGGVSTYFSYNYGFSITAGNTYSSSIYNSAFSGSMFINNNSGYTITALYMSTIGYGSGPNQITTNILNGATREFVDIPPGTYYVRAVRNSVNSDGMAPVTSINYTNVTVN